ncbi:hypothetical protein CQA53_09160, partial [Helicobacter didelphidarum]
LKETLTQNSLYPSTHKRESNELTYTHSPHQSSNASCDTYKKLDFHTLSDEEKSEGFVFHILSDGVSEENKTKLVILQDELNRIYPCKIVIHTMSDKDFKDFKVWREGKNHIVYLRIKLASIFPQNLKICLYLDVDMLVLADLRELFSIDLEDKVAGVVLDGNSPGKMNPIGSAVQAKHKHLEDYHISQSYFNSGFMLINLVQWRAHDIEQKCFYFLENYNVLVCDQDALNFAIGDNALTLSMRFNIIGGYYSNVYQYIYSDEHDTLKDTEIAYFIIPHTRDEFYSILQSPKIIHYIWTHKPWQKALDSNKLKILEPNPYKLWWQNACQTPVFGGYFAYMNESVPRYELELELKQLKRLNERIEHLNQKRISRRIQRIIDKIRGKK